MLKDNEGEEMRAKITQELSDIFRQMGVADAIDEVEKKVSRPYNRSAPNAKPMYARFKIWLQYQDGNKAMFYSYDNLTTTGGEIVNDEWSGFKKLIAYYTKNQTMIRRCVIYATLDPGKSTNAKTYDYEICNFDQYGNKKANKATNFVPQGKNTILDIERMRVYGHQKIPR